MEKVRKEDKSMVPFQERSQNEGFGSNDGWSMEAEEDLTGYEELIASLFKESNIAFVFGKRKLYLQKEHVIAVSPVFEAMFSSKFLEGSLKEIPLPEDTVHHMLPLSEEYQTDDLKKRIEEFLIKGVLFESDSITSVKIIIKILEAEKYKLNGYLNACIGVASRKQVHISTNSPKFEEISQNTQLKIGLKRMHGIDNIYNNARPNGSIFKAIHYDIKTLGTRLHAQELINVSDLIVLI
ncbi:Hypothetical predicted protein [Mytilus galloprovincialis]|uniref:BTB domain-containing protein n=1 Tax=Mytilus galloprovincialis TaxID=29158 RepID=A0A8B6EII6_MYTGA|nr:Hypothetical predicted protein [Mytilus galloprovincialis]